MRHSTATKTIAVTLGLSSALVVVLFACQALDERDTAAQAPLSLEISAAQTEYVVGQVPAVRVALTNNTSEPINLAGSLDGSDVRWRFPHCYFEINGPDGKPAARGIGRCGNMNALREQDFVEVAPKGTFDPFRGPDGTMFFSAHQLSPTTFQTPGTYKISFVYSTESEKFEDWLGDGRLDAKLQELCASVPRTTLRSNEIRVTILPKGATSRPTSATKKPGAEDS